MAAGPARAAADGCAQSSSSSAVDVRPDSVGWRRPSRRAGGGRRGSVMGPSNRTRQAAQVGLAWRVVRARVAMANTCSNDHAPYARPRGTAVADQLIIRGAREHNLKDVSLDLPRDSLIVFTGLSGSGKSQPRLRHDLRRGPAPLRRVAVGLRPAVPRPDGQARRRLHRGPLARGLDRPEVHLEEPALDRRHHHRGLRLPPPALRPRRPAALPDLRRADRAADPAADRRPGAGARGGHPVPGAGAGDPRPQGRVRRPVPPAADPGLLPRPGRRRDLPARPSRPTLDKQKKHTIEVVVDRLAVKASSKRRLTDSVETALGLAGGLVVFDFVDLDRPKDPGRELRFSEKMACPNEHPIDTDELEPRSFSFNSPFGACPDCHGLGTRMEVDPELVIADPTATLGEGAIAPWSRRPRRRLLPPAARRARRRARLRPRHAVGGPAGQGADVDPRRATRPRCTSGTPTATAASAPTTPHFEGVRPYIERRHREAESDTSRERFEGFMREVPCPACGGTRLKPVSMSVTIGRQRNIAEVCALPINEAADFLARPRAVHPRAADRRAGAQGDPGAAQLPARRRPRLPLARPALGLAVRRRGAADPARHPDRRRPGRRPLRPRRAVHRPAPARQPPADRDPGPAQGPRQHPDRRRARRGHHPDRRLGRRHRPGRRRARRPGGGLRHRRRTCSSTPTPQTGHVPLRPQADPGARGAPSAHAGSRAGRPRRQGAQPPGHRRRRSRSGCSSRSPASPAPASPRWSTTSSTPRWPSRSTTPARSRAGTAGSRASTRSTR